MKNSDLEYGIAHLVKRLQDCMGKISCGLFQFIFDRFSYSIYQLWYTYLCDIVYLELVLGFFNQSFLPLGTVPFLAAPDS